MSSSMISIAIDSNPPVPGRLIVEREAITQMSALPRPDPKWTYVDAAGHWHAYGEVPDSRERYPTLLTLSEYVPCGGACEEGCDGYYEDRYECRICGEEITPGELTGEHTFTVPGPLDWRIEITTTEPGFRLRPGATVTVRAYDVRCTYFGLGLVHSATAGPDGIRAQTLIVAAGPLGTRSRSS